jgi:hypothetical protein
MQRKFPKGLINLKEIFLYYNNIILMDAKIFSHLGNLEILDLQGNKCVSKFFRPVTSMAEVEKALAMCAANS